MLPNDTNIQLELLTVGLRACSGTVLCGKEKKKRINLSRKKMDKSVILL